MKVYLSGIVHGSESSHDIHNQAYREQIKNALSAKYKNVTVFSPVDKDGPKEIEDHGEAEKKFFEMIQQALMSDLIIAYLPAASMGSAIEIWEAYKNSKPVVIISPLKQNWTVRFLSTVVCKDLGEFEAYVASGKLDDLVLDRYEKRD